MRTLGRVVLRTGAAIALVLAVVGWPLTALAVAAVLWVLVRVEPSS